MRLGLDRPNVITPSKAPGRKEAAATISDGAALTLGFVLVLPVANGSDCKRPDGTINGAKLMVVNGRPKPVVVKQ